LELRITIRLNIDRIGAGGECNGMVSGSVRWEGGGWCEEIGVLVEKGLDGWGEICGFSRCGSVEDMELIIGINCLSRDKATKLVEG
jgi:hypothetical protein